jgi:hypothetical protein
VSLDLDVLDVQPAIRGRPDESGSLGLTVDDGGYSPHSQPRASDEHSDKTADVVLYTVRSLVSRRTTIVGCNTASLTPSNLLENRSQPR